MASRVLLRSMNYHKTFSAHNDRFKMGMCATGTLLATVASCYLGYNCFKLNRQVDDLSHYAVSQDIQATFPFLAYRQARED
uniref:COX6C domain-containing protein n=1 Tax=Steinernema glaseri TaxID=37863 RepID=A0A1I7ZIR5_9BILA